MKFDRRWIVVGACAFLLLLAGSSLAVYFSHRLGPRVYGATAPVKLRCMSCGGQYTLEAREYRHRGALIYHPRYAKGEAMPKCPLCKAVHASMLPAVCPSCKQSYIVADGVAQPPPLSPEDLKKLCPFEHP